MLNYPFFTLDYESNKIFLSILSTLNENWMLKANLNDLVVHRRDPIKQSLKWPIKCIIGLYD